MNGVNPNPYHYQGIDPNYQGNPSVQMISNGAIENALARIARALEGIEAELRSRRQPVPTGNPEPASVPQGTTKSS
jgi:hypothetical protein